MSAPIPHAQAHSQNQGCSRIIWLHVFVCIGLLVCGGLVYLGQVRWACWLGGGVLLLHGGVVALGVTQLRWQLFGPTFCHGARSTRCIALTFDDGPDPEATPLLLDVLERWGAKATFFCIGRHVRAYPDIVRRIDQEGHELGNHSESHSSWLNLASLATYRTEVKEAQEAIQAVVGREPKWYRPPIGLSNPRMARVVKELGLRVIGWDVRSLDTWGQAPEITLARIVKQVQGGSIVLLHDQASESVVLLEKLLLYCQENDWNIVPLGDLMMPSTTNPENNQQDD